MAGSGTRRNLGVALLAVVLLASGCASGPRFAPIEAVPGQAVVYLYRDNLLVGRGLDLEIFMNDVSAAVLRTGTYLAARVAPGEYTFKARATPVPGATLLTGVRDDQLRANTLLRLRIEAGEVYYVQVEEGLGYVLLEPIAAAPGRAQIGRLRPAEGSL